MTGRVKIRANDDFRGMLCIEKIILISADFNLMSIKKIFVVCPTYRDPFSVFNFRLFGVVSLVEQMRNQSFDGRITICIVDTSPNRHPFFECFENDQVSEDLLYFHIPQRDIIDEKIVNKFPYAASFIPTLKDIDSKRWQRLIAMNVAWDRFIPWDNKYPVKNTIKEQIYGSRPNIGMARNFAIASLYEKFGKADYIFYADDDDFRNKNYIEYIFDRIGNNDFVRMMKFYTYHISKNLWGMYDINLVQDVNGNWLPSSKDKKNVLYNGIDDSKYRNYTLEQRFPPLLALAFPHISCDGALQVFKFKLWEDMIPQFGGIPITSIAEDIIFYRNCKDCLGYNFKSDEIKVNGKPNFLKVSDEENATVLEWNYNLKETEVENWALDKIKEFNTINSQQYDLNRYYEELGKSFFKTDKINW